MLFGKACSMEVLSMYRAEEALSCLMAFHTEQQPDPLQRRRSLTVPRRIYLIEIAALLRQNLIELLYQLPLCIP